MGTFIGNGRHSGNKARVFLCAAAVAFFAGNTPASDKLNYVTYDFGPAIIGNWIASFGDHTDDSFNTSGFGLALQYERQINPFFSAGARFAYLGAGMGYSASMYDITLGIIEELSLKQNFSSFNFESNARLYPTGKSFFLNGSLGYGTFGTGLKGRFYYTERDGKNAIDLVDLSMTASYLKLGLKTGYRWLIRNSFIIEMSTGYDFSTRVGDGIGTKLGKKFGGDIDSDLDDMFDFFANHIFVGGFRITLAAGWAF
ncbi:MAG: hypothetical protein LBI42_11705 [Chitinispirillales bacterium]|jgi:hypothetical protein|nr:hypothetical protein [Chitinispirillales bacterium]